MFLLVLLLTLVFALTIPQDITCAEELSGSDYPVGVRLVLENAQPLEHPLGNRFPLLLWPAMDCVVEDEALQERMVVDLHKRGIAAIATWTPESERRKKSLADGLRLARIQQKLGRKVCVNANACMYAFNNGDPVTAYMDQQGNPFFDESIPGNIGSPFRLEHRYAAMREQVAFFARGYHVAGVPLDFVFGDWEIDGPLEINRAWDAAKRCVVTREKIPDIETNFESFQKVVRLKRAEMTRQCYSDPLLSHYPHALVGNYAVYPHDGLRYWYDYFEFPVDHHPHVTFQNAIYRRWYHEFPLTGYTFAMPVIYPWSRIYDWYDWKDTDYRWFHNILLVASNAGKNTRQQAPGTPAIGFIHWHTIFLDTNPKDPGRFVQLSERAYHELVWHVMLRGVDGLFLWCMEQENVREVTLLHKAWAETLSYADFLNNGEPVFFDVPTDPGPVVSAVRWGDELLVRRTDFGAGSDKPIDIKIDNAIVSVPAVPGECQVIRLPDARRSPANK